MWERLMELAAVGAAPGNKPATTASKTKATRG
jgi:hypothetical protein